MQQRKARPEISETRQDSGNQRVSTTLNLNDDSELHINGLTPVPVQKSSSDKRSTGAKQKPAGVKQMIKNNLRDFIETVIDSKYISADDVKKLQREILEDGIMSRIEAEALLALDRSLDTDASWGPALTALVVDFMVWGMRPTGVVPGDDALWLTTALDVGGPTETAMNIVYAILDETQHVDAALLDFIMRGRQHARLQSLAA
jgi:hypothetical protein